MIFGVPKRDFWLIAPYAAWMVLMMALPALPVSPAAAYAVRTFAVAVLLVFAVGHLYPRKPVGGFSWRQLAWGVAVGTAVFAIWVAPEKLFGIGGSAASAEPSPYAPETCGWPLTAIRLFGSAVIIAAAEELFFRRWLLDFAGFWWMVALFAIEHDRYVVGAIAGAIYGLLAIRKGLSAAIVAHMTTNFILGIYVIFSGEWQYW
jgi:CAAX prenyl protease-like protein